MNKQISLTMPETLFKASEEYYRGLGYLNLQEFVLDLIRKKVVLTNIDRYKQIEERMKKGKGVKKLSQKQAVKYLRGL